jgi:hypothetical protein
MAEAKQEPVHIVFHEHPDYVVFRTSDNRSGSNPIWPGENADMTKGRILQSLGLYTNEYYTSETI